MARLINRILNIYIYIQTHIFFRIVYSAIYYISKNASINMEKWLRIWSCTDLKTVINFAKSIWKEEIEINCTEYKSGFVFAKLGQAATQINWNRSKPCAELLGRILYCFKYFLSAKELTLSGKSWNIQAAWQGSDKKYSGEDSFPYSAHKTPAELMHCNLWSLAYPLLLTLNI